MPGIPTAAPNVARVTYDATRNADGSYTIHDVPTVGELAAGERSNAEAIGREWMESVIATHMAQLVGGFAAPMHAGHRTALGEPTALGTFVPMAVRKMSVDGREQFCLVSDLTVDEETLEAIRAGRYPYRSIEVDWAAGKIGSLALMAGAPPHFPFPMLRDVRVIGDAATLAPVTLAAPIVACVARDPDFVPVAADARHRTLVRLAAYAVEGDEEEAPADGAEKGDKPPFAKADAAESENKPAADAPADATGKGLAAVMAVCARILEVLMGKKPEDRLQPARDETPEDSGDQTAPKGADDDASEKPAKETDDMAATTTTLDAATTAKLAQLDTLTGKIASLESQVTALSAENSTLKAENAKAKRAEMIAAAKTRLRAKRVQIPADFDVRGDRLALLGAAALEDLVVTLETSGRKDPPETFADALGLSGVAADEAEIALYADTPVRLEAARREAAVWRAYKAATPDTQLTLAKHLAIRVGAEGTPVSA